MTDPKKSKLDHLIETGREIGFYADEVIHVHKDPETAEQVFREYGLWKFELNSFWQQKNSPKLEDIIKRSDSIHGLFTLVARNGRSSNSNVRFTVIGDDGKPIMTKETMRQLNALKERAGEILDVLVDMKTLDIEKTVNPKKSQINLDGRKVQYWITYPKIREVTLNDIYILSKPDFERENDKFFTYVYNNPNIVIPKSDIEKEIGAKLKKTFHNILKDLGFVGEIKKAFFTGISKNSIVFHNEVDSNLNGASKLLLEKQIKKIKRK